MLVEARQGRKFFHESKEIGELETSLAMYGSVVYNKVKVDRKRNSTIYERQLLTDVS